MVKGINSIRMKSDDPLMAAYQTMQEMYGIFFSWFVVTSSFVLFRCRCEQMMPKNKSWINEWWLYCLLNLIARLILIVDNRFLMLINSVIVVCSLSLLPLPQNLQ